MNKYKEKFHFNDIIGWQQMKGKIEMYRKIEVQ